MNTPRTSRIDIFSILISFRVAFISNGLNTYNYTFMYVPKVCWHCIAIKYIIQRYYLT